MPSLILGAGIFLTFKTHFFQFRKFHSCVKILTDKDANKNTLSPFSALTTALAGSVGIGSIVGVATALSLGGPGAVLWMLFFAFAGMIIKYAEILLAMKYRIKAPNGQLLGGPMYYLKYGAHSPIGAFIYALSAVLASFGIGNICQSNSASTVLSYEFGIPQWLSGSILAFLCGIIILRGVKGIAKFTSIAIPIIDVLFLLCGLFAILANLNRLPSVLDAIWQDAFRPTAAGGGLLGALISQPMRYGISRGIFSSEAGLGSASIVHAAIQSKEPVRHAMLGILEVFISVVLACGTSALVLLLPGIQNLEGAAYASAAYEAALPGFGRYFIPIILCLFALSAPLSWSFYGEQALRYLLKNKFTPGAQLCYRLFFLFVLFWGATTKASIVWSLSDLLNALMALPNLAALLLLSGDVWKETKGYLQKHR